MKKVVVIAIIIGALGAITIKFQKYIESLGIHIRVANVQKSELYPSGSAPARIYGTRKMHKVSPNHSFPKLHLIVSSIGTFNYNLARFLL